MYIHKMKHKLRGSKSIQKAKRKKKNDRSVKWRDCLGMGTSRRERVKGEGEGG
jgi:hypothetical protein